MVEKKIMPKRLVLIGSNELVVSNVAHQMKEKKMIQNIISSSEGYFFIDRVVEYGMKQIL